MIGLCVEAYETVVQGNRSRGEKVMKTRCIAFLTVFCLFTLGTVAFAQNYRCSGKLIRKGMTKVDLIENCGEPDRMLSIVSSNRGVMVKQQVLLYDPGAKKYAVTIASGTIFRINEYADYQLRCKGRTISVGDSEESVLENCGPPLDMQQILFGDFESPEKGNRILYRRGPDTAVVVTKDEEVVYIVIQKAGHR
jgi:hypothetical protein